MTWDEINAGLRALPDDFDSGDRNDWLSEQACPDCGETRVIRECSESGEPFCEECHCRWATGYSQKALAKVVAATRQDREGYCETCGDALDRHLVCRRCQMERLLDMADDARDG